MVENQKSPYEILGIQKTNDFKAIKDAYKAKSIQWHPDRNRDPDATSKFQEINDANSLLMSEGKAVYDLFGFDGLKIYSYNKARSGIDWIIVLIILSTFWLIDWIFTIHIEWILALPILALLGFIFYHSVTPIKIALVYLAMNVVLYFILPTRLIPSLANMLLYNIILSYTPCIRFDIKSIKLFQTESLFFFFMNYRGVQINFWLWKIFGINIIIFSSVLVVLIYYYKTEALMSLGKDKETLNDHEKVDSFKSSLFLIYSVLFLVIWILYYFTSIRLDFYLVALAGIVQILFNFNIVLIVTYSFTLAVTYYLVPWSIYNFIVNYGSFGILLLTFGSSISNQIYAIEELTPEDIKESDKSVSKFHINLLLYIMIIHSFIIDLSTKDYSPLLTSLAIVSFFIISFNALIQWIEPGIASKKVENTGDIDTIILNSEQNLGQEQISDINNNTPLLDFPLTPQTNES